MNSLDKQYTDLLQDIINNGIVKGDRTGTGTVSVFGRTIRHKMSEGFPLLTTKKMPFKTIATELIWFLRGDTNIQWLVQNGCNIWNGDCYKNYREKHRILYKDVAWTEKEFIEKIKTDDDFARKWGNLGPIYGRQWRKWYYGNPVMVKTGELYASGEFKYDIVDPSIDQMANLIHDLKTNPDSRRLMVNAWNVGEIGQMVLPPCHYGFQVYSRNATNKELEDYLIANIPELYYDMSAELVNDMTVSLFEVVEKYNKNAKEANAHGFGIGIIPTRTISLMWSQRSVDTFLGLPFNIASYGLLLEILAKEVNMIPDELIGNLGDTHLYLNHLDQAKIQIGAELSDEEINDLLKKLDIETYNKYISAMASKRMAIESQRYEDASKYRDIERETRDILAKLPIPNTNRDPYPLPHIKIKDTPRANKEDCLPYYQPNDFELIGYLSHPTIKAKLSN